MNQILITYWAACVFGIILLGFTLDFLTRFVIRGLKLGRYLKQSIVALDQLRNTLSAITDLQTIAGKPMTTDTLDHLWHEYAKTLHPQREMDEFGRNRVIRWRATALAEMFFTPQAIVDSPLRTDYYKHLPGILTGIGIIGTFTGLIQGLLHFNVSGDSKAVETALGSLLVAMGHAFFISGAAIFLAMAFTLLEKLIVSSLYRKVEKLQQKVNRLFAAGAEDEYLERIVKASETSATQAVQIKDSLVADLKQILSELSGQQLAAAAQHSDRVSASLGKAIAMNLAPITQGFESVRATQGEVVSKLLVDVLAGFSNEMKDMFGAQMGGTQQLLQTTNLAMQAIAGNLEQLASNINRSGNNAADAMAERLIQALGGMEERQQRFREQMTELGTRLSALAAESRTAVPQQMNETLAVAVGQLRSHAEAFAGRQEEQINRNNRESGAALDSISSRVEQVIVQSIKTNQALEASVSALSASTGNSITKMHSSAEMLCVASNDLARAGTRVAESLKLASGTVENMRAAAESLTAASNTTQQVSAEYARSRDVFAGMVNDLKLTVENAKHEAAMTSGLLANLQRGADQLGAAQKRAADYLSEVNEVLGKSHQAFALNIDRTLRSANGAFHKHLEEAVGHLSGGIQDLGELLEQIPAPR